jgi:hypothetical protein
MNIKTLLLGAAVVALASTAMVSGAAAQTISSASTTAGINNAGEVFNGDVGVGLRRNADGYDPILPGTPRDSWGLNGNYADQYYFGFNGIASTNTVYGASSATTTTLTTDGFKVVQNFTLSNNILRDATTVTNLNASAVSVQFARDVDYDISPTEFDENTSGHYGNSALVTDASFYGFENPAGNAVYGSSIGPCAPCTFGPGDLGAGIRINLGSIGAGGSRSFNYYYGINNVGENPGGLLADTFGAGAKYVMLGTSSNDGPKNSITLGVSGGVPEPATWAMMIMGFFGLGSVVRRRRAVAAA